jgi:hypothetical protein
MCDAFGSCTRFPRGKGPGEGPEWWRGGTGSDFSVFRRCITSTHFRCGLGSKTTESSADLVISFQSATFWSKHAGAGVAASGRGVLSEI